MKMIIKSTLILSMIVLLFYLVNVYFVTQQKSERVQIGPFSGSEQYDGFGQSPREICRDIANSGTYWGETYAVWVPGSGCYANDGTTALSGWHRVGILYLRLSGGKP